MNENTCGNPIISHQDTTTFLTLNRPEKCNALSVAVWRNIPALLKEAVARKETRVIVLRGADGNFAADADITEFDSVLADRATARVYVQIMGAATAAIEMLPIPVIAILEGQCVGAAVSLALACDIRLASTDARFAMTSAKLGLVYPFADTKRLVDTVGVSIAKDLLFTGRTINAARALEIGLVDDALEPVALDLALAERVQLISEVSPWSILATKRIISEVLGGTSRETRHTLDMFADGPLGCHYREGVAALRESRKPIFPSR